MMCSVGILANLMLLIAFVKDPLKCFRNSATYLVGNLALSDLLCNFLFMVNISLSSEHVIAYSMLNFVFYSSIGTIFSIALDRFLLIRYPFKHRILMSDKKMAVWIAIIWFLSCIHPLKMIFVLDKFDNMVKPGAGSVLIILTGILYSRTYFTLRKQNGSMVGMKAKFSSMRNDKTANESISSDSGICVRQIGTTQHKNQRSKSQTERGLSYRVRSKRAQSQDERVQSQDERVQSQDDRAQSQDNGVKSQLELVNSRADCAQIKGQRAQSQNTRHKGENDYGEIQNDRAQIQRDIQDSSKTSVTHKGSSLHNSSSKTQKKLQSVNKAKEQRFLNTIIIIACIAVATVLVGTTYAQLSQTVLKERSEMERILKLVCFAIFCLNFTINPFVYCLRLKQYQKTFQMIYGCKF